MGVEIRNIVKSFNYAFSLLQRENTPVQKLLENTEKECLIFVYMRIMYKHTHTHTHTHSLSLSLPLKRFAR